MFNKAIATLAPIWALKRLRAQLTLRSYEAAGPSRLHAFKSDNNSHDMQVGQASESLRAQARHLEQNHDLSAGLLDVLVHNIVGTGISIEPQVKNVAGELDCDFNRQLLNCFSQWMLSPAISSQLDWHSLCRLICRAWLRDGEVLIRLIEGNIPQFEHLSHLPFSIDVLEADFLPLDLSDRVKHIQQGIEKNSFGQVVAYHVTTEHPANTNLHPQTRRITANQIIHLKLVKRCHQNRGVSLFAPVLKRLSDLKDYEDSERIAARMSAAMTAYIKKPMDGFNPLTMGAEDKDRYFDIKPGLFFDNLNPGEEINTIQSNRPSQLLSEFRNAMLRAIAAGTRTSYSSIAKDYNGTYSAQRQELVEQAAHYAVLRQEFIAGFIRPIWTRWLHLMMAAKHIEIAPNIDINTLINADYRGPVIPWIDPLKEVKADVEAVNAGFKSRSQVIRERGGDPITVCDQKAREQND